MSYCNILSFVVAIMATLTSVSTVTHGQTILRNARIIDGTGKPAQDGMDIVIEGKVIKAISPTQSTIVPEGATTIDYQGKTIIPGLISTHSHLGQYSGIDRSADHFNRENIIRQLRQYEAYGVTTVLSLGTNLPLLYELRDESKAGKLAGAEILSADYGIGAMMGAPGIMLLNDIDQINRPTNPEAARKAVLEAKDRGADYIKMWVDSRNMPTVPKEIFTAVIDEAHKYHLKVFVHIFTLADAKALVEAGVDVIAHGIRDQPVDQELVELMKSKKTFYIPTIQLDESFYIYADRPSWFREPFFRHSVQQGLAEQIDSTAWHQKTLASPSLKGSREAVLMNQRNISILHKAGIPIGFGTDSGAFPLRIPGFAEHRELELLESAALTPLEVITIATSQSARLLGLVDRGAIQPGLRADLLVLDADPISDITNTHRIHAVWHKGRKTIDAVTSFTP